MSLWEFMAVMAGFARFNSGGGQPSAPDLTDAQLREMGVVGF